MKTSINCRFKFNMRFGIKYKTYTKAHLYIETGVSI